MRTAIPRRGQTDHEVEQRRDHVDVLVAVEVVDGDAQCLGAGDLGGPFGVDLVEGRLALAGVDEPPQPDEAAAKARPGWERRGTVSRCPDQ